MSPTASNSAQFTDVPDVHNHNIKQIERRINIMVAGGWVFHKCLTDLKKTLREGTALDVEALIPHPAPPLHLNALNPLCTPMAIAHK